MLIVAGLMLVVLGLLLIAGERLPIRLGHLPGDILIKGRHGTFYLPLTTCLLLSILLTLVMWAISRWR
jgi:hypothetical protein